MQFHLNGFQPGDPAIAEPSKATHPDSLPEKVDVLIVGSGPAGLTLAAQLSAFPDITTRIIEQKSGPMQLGQADGIACRTVEMFNAFGFAESLLKEACWINETTFWRPDENNRQNIVRSGRIQDTEDGLSEFPHVILNQARVHDHYLEIMRNSANRLEPDYGWQLADLRIDSTVGGGEREQAYPVTVQLERTDPGHEGQTETIKARYVVGCDGARSAVRASLGRELHGDSANKAWGVMDILAITDFPDVRMKTLIHSSSEGNVLIIPREGGYLFRMYIELDKLKAGERVAGRNITVDQLISAAGRILNPYTLDVKEVAWWSVYEIGQRICDRFDDVPDNEAGERMPRVFIAGDACHTHSQKAGQGMNVSMQDTFNLGWKLAAVLRGQCGPKLLHTYTAERQAIAQDLIDFDREWSKMLGMRPKTEDEDGVDPAETQDYFVRHGRYTAGTVTRYTPSVLTGTPAHQDLAKGLTIGMRFHSAPVIRLADAKPMQLGHTVQADGRWRIFAFAGADDAGGSSSAVAHLCTYLADTPGSPVRKFTQANADIDSVIDVRAIFQQGHRTLALDTMPPFLMPQKGRYGLRDYEKIFCSDPGADIFDMRDIDRQKGCMVLVRPDQHVAHVLPLNAHAELAAFFEGFMVEQVGANPTGQARQMQPA